MKAVKEAERSCSKRRTARAISGPRATSASSALLEPICLRRGRRLGGRLTALQTPGGTGALRLGAELVATRRTRGRGPHRTPTWPNHAPIFAAARLAMRRTLRRSRDAGGRFRQRARKRSPGRGRATSSCCTAAATTRPASISPASSGRRSPRCLRRESSCRSSISPIRASATASRRTLRRRGSILDAVDEALVAYSCDKNFGLYRDRVGALYVLARDATRGGDGGEQPRGAWRASTGRCRPTTGRRWCGSSSRRPRSSRCGASELDWHARPDQRQPRGARRRRPGARLHPRPARPVLEPAHDEGAGRGAARAATRSICADSGRINLAGMQPGDAGAIVAALRAEGCLTETAAA